MKKLLSLLLSAVMLLVPVIGSAETATGYGYFTIANPILNITADGETISLDLTGLELDVAAEGSDDAFSLLVSVLANGSEALSGHAALDETGFYAALEGMETALTIPMETLEALAQEFLAELESAAADMPESIGIIGGADAPTDIFVSGEFGDMAGSFSEEELNKFSAAAEEFASSIIVSDPVDDTVFENDAEVPAQRVDYNIESASLAAIGQAFGDLLMSNEEFAEGYKEGIEEVGGEYIPLGDFLNQAFTVYNISVSGSIFMSETGSIYADNYVYFTDDNGEEETVNLYLSVTSDDEGDYIFAGMYPEGDDYAEFFLASMASTEVEGETDFYCDLTLYTGEEEVACIAVIVAPYFDDNGVVNTLADLTMTADGTEVSFGASWYAQEDIYGGVVYVTATEFDGEDTTTSDITIGYDGMIAEDGMTHTGVLWADVYVDDNEYGDFVCDITFGVDQSGESIAHDFSGYTMLDLTTASDDDFTALSEEASNVLVMGLLGIISEIPSLASMLG